MNKFIAPIRIKIEVYIKGESKTGSAIIDYEWGQLPTKEELKDRLVKFKEEIKEMTGQSFEMMNEEDFFDQFMIEETGSHEKFAAPANLRKFELDI